MNSGRRAVTQPTEWGKGTVDMARLDCVNGRKLFPDHRGRTELLDGRPADCASCPGMRKGTWHSR